MLLVAVNTQIPIREFRVDRLRRGICRLCWMPVLLAASLDRAAARHPDPGRTETLRRLNRAEYQNSIRDLLALDIDAAALLPKDDVSHGFDNVSVGNVSPTLLDRYISAAQKISRL